MSSDKSQDSFRYIGLVIDNYMHCEKTVNSIIGNVNSKLKFLYGNCKYTGVGGGLKLVLRTKHLVSCSVRMISRWQEKIIYLSHDTESVIF